MTKLPATVVVADDHEVFRTGTKTALAEIGECTVVDEAANGIEAIACVKKHRPTLLVLDATMPLCSGIEVYADARRWSPDTKICLFTGFTSATMLAHWLDAGIDGILLKTCTAAEVRHGLHIVLNGGHFICEDAADILEAAAAPPTLTARELEVLSMVASGKSNAEIAERLAISKKTVDKHRGSMMNKLGVHSVAELMAYAIREGLLDELKQL